MNNEERMSMLSGIQIKNPLSVSNVIIKDSYDDFKVVEKLNKNWVLKKILRIAYLIMCLIFPTLVFIGVMYLYLVILKCENEKIFLLPLTYLCFQISRLMFLYYDDLPTSTKYIISYEKKEIEEKTQEDTSEIQIHTRDKQRASRRHRDSHKRRKF